MFRNNGRRKEPKTGGRDLIAGYVDEDVDEDEEGVNEPPKAFIFGVISSVVGVLLRHIRISPSLLQRLSSSSSSSSLLLRSSSPLLNVNTIKLLSKLSLSIFLLSSACMRFDEDVVDTLRTLVPPPLPKTLAVYITGIIEFLLSILLVIPKYTLRGGLYTTLLFVAYIPSHLYHNYSTQVQEELDVGQPYTIIRLIIQMIFIYWSTWFIKP